MDEVDVLCINCDNFISINAISSHSFICVIPINFLAQDENNERIGLIDQRLSKLCASLESLTQNKKIRSLKTYSALKDLLVQTRKAKLLTPIQMTTPSIFAELVHSIGKYTDESLSCSIIIYAERLKVLIEEKIHLSIQKDKINKEMPTDIPTGKDAKESQTTISKRGLNNFHPGEFSKNKKFHLSDVDSVMDFLTLKSPSSASASMNEKSENISFSSPQEPSDENIYDSDEMEQLFITQCLMTQLSYTSSHAVQKINFKGLYKKSRKLCISFENWDKFIDQQFKQAIL